MNLLMVFETKNMGDYRAAKEWFNSDESAFYYEDVFFNPMDETVGLCFPVSDHDDAIALQKALDEELRSNLLTCNGYQVMR